jgi:hypothetical protein
MVLSGQSAKSAPMDFFPVDIVADQVAHVVVKGKSVQGHFRVMESAQNVQRLGDNCPIAQRGTLGAVSNQTNMFHKFLRRAHRAECITAFS